MRGADLCTIGVFLCLTNGVGDQPGDFGPALKQAAGDERQNEEAAANLVPECNQTVSPLLQG